MPKAPHIEGRLSNFIYLNKSKKEPSFKNFGLKPANGPNNNSYELVI